MKKGFTLIMVAAAMVAAAVMFSACGGSGKKEKKDKKEKRGEMLYPIRQDGKWGYIDKEGKVVVKPKYDVASIAPEGDYEGYYIVGIGDKYGFMDNSGKVVIDMKYDGINFFTKDGLARVMVKTPRVDSSYSSYNSEKWGFIDEKGDYVVEPQYGYAGDFHEGMAAVGTGEYPNRKWGFIDKTGKMVIEPQYIGANRFTDGVAVVWYADDDMAYIDKTGKVLWREKSGKRDVSVAVDSTRTGDAQANQQNCAEAEPAAEAAWGFD